MSEVYDYAPERERGDRFIVREHTERQAPGTHMTVGVDMSADPNEPRNDDLNSAAFHSLAPPRRVQMYVGGFDELYRMASRADRFKAKILWRELNWLNGVVRRAGMEIALLRDATPEDQ